MSAKENEKKYCISCGAEIFAEAVMCPYCKTMQHQKSAYSPTKTVPKTNFFLLASCVIASLDLLGLLAYIAKDITYTNYLGGYGQIIFLIVMSVSVAALWTSFLTKSRSGALFGAIILCISPIAMPAFIPYLILPVIFAWIGFAKSQKATQLDGNDIEIPSDFNKTNKASYSSVQNPKYANVINSTISNEPKPKYKHTTIRVVGVTFDNEDGTNRQQILRHIRFRDPPFDNNEPFVEIRPYDYHGEDAIEVLVEDQVIGNIPRGKVQEIMKDFDKYDGITAIDIIGGGEDEYGDRLKYGAEITIRFRV